ncbi:S9 family peptidase [Pseudohongiella nitratireducens]|uniref:S9 family peptidase n=1 Tax=Pseudohongiella nitratireducens TaxID=1768907 RepID=UPI0030EDFD5F
MHKQQLTPSDVFSANDNLAYLQWNQEGCFCIRTRASEDNLPRVVQVSDQGDCLALTPPGLAVRTRLHEYGGRPYLVSRGTLYFCRDDTQQIMQLDLQHRNTAMTQTGHASALTPDEGQCQLRYADFCHDSLRQRLYAVREDHRGDTVLNTLVAITLPDSNEPGDTPQDEGLVLFSESDFIASPRLSPDGRHLAFVSWSHPNMPWDNTQLQVLTVDEAGAPEGCITLGGMQDGAIQQLQFDPSGRLWFLTDVAGWWQLYYLPCLSDTLGQQGAVLDISQAIPFYTPDQDCASPPWIVGQQQFAITAEQMVACTTVYKSRWTVEVISQRDDPDSIVIADNFSHVESLACHDGRIRMIAGTPEQAGALLEYHHGTLQTLIQPGLLPATAQSTPTAPAHITYSTGTNANSEIKPDCNPEQAHALLYLPEESTAKPPPLIVTVHGGPSSSAKSGLNPMTQYWLQQGFAILDVDHRGSTGYGRRFRKRLYGDWGKIDLEDIIAAVQYVADKQLINPDAIFIRGGSAGGYAVLAALCHSDLFKGGACYYGISDMITLAAETHKFESHYIEQLIGALPEFAERYRERSPIHHIDKIHSPVLFLHGELDKVVPPQQARMIYQALKPRIPKCQIMVFPDEAHGFRKLPNQIKALECEKAFYQSVLLQHEGKN